MNKDFDTNWDAPVTVRHETAANAPSKSSHAVKQIVTIRLDVDMLDWFKAEGPGYQTRINQVLREHMEARRAEKAAA
ncbi:MAG: BrnA antitoxin family protein [Telluria sp.]